MKSVSKDRGGLRNPPPGVVSDQRETKNDSVISTGENKLYLAIDTKNPTSIALPLIIDT
jgi:hypothetical protein